MDKFEIASGFIFGAFIIIMLYLGLRKGKKERDFKETKEGKNWIPYRELVDSKKSFKACPNCGDNEVVMRSFGLMMPIILDPACQSCKYVFISRNESPFKGFHVMSPEEHEKWQDKKIEEQSKKRLAKAQ